MTLLVPGEADLRLLLDADPGRKPTLDGRTGCGANAPWLRQTGNGGEEASPPPASAYSMSKKENDE